MKITAPMMRVLQKGRAMTTFHDLAAKWEAEAAAMIEDGGECERHMAREVMTRAAELRAELTRGGWQTMETAPRDGTRVLLYDPEGIYVGMWLDDGVPSPGDPPGWMGFVHDDSGICGLLPTHWQPLPELPR